MMAGWVKYTQRETAKMKPTPYNIEWCEFQVSTKPPSMYYDDKTCSICFHNYNCRKKNIMRCVK